MAEHRFTEEQFAEILRRATEMQARLPARSGESGGKELAPATGMSLDDIRAIAAEVGIDPDLVSRAALQVAEQPRPIEGKSDRWVLSHSSTGELSEDDRARVLRAIRDAAGAHGSAEMVGPSLEWRSSSSEASRTLVTLDPVDGRNELRVTVDASAVAVLTQLFGTFAGAFAGIIIGASIEPGLAGGIGLVGALGGSGFAVGRGVWNRLRRGIVERSQRIMSAAAAALPESEN